VTMGRSSIEFCISRGKTLRPLFTRHYQMNAPPPGYNPGESILQGGNTTIQPVMGGGGGHGDPEQSLLSGGNSANIIPLKGGRRMIKKASRKTYPVRAKIVSTLPPSVAKALKALGMHLGGQKKKV